MDTLVLAFNDQRSRRPWVYSLGLVLVILLGLASRRYGPVLSPALAGYSGDALWAMMVFLIGGLIFPTWSTKRLFFAAIAVAWLIELSQLYHAPWIDGIRRTTVGHLALGDTFVWSDLVCYLIGAGVAALLECMSATESIGLNKP
jgi:hypothetical protein